MMATTRRTRASVRFIGNDENEPNSGDEGEIKKAKVSQKSQSISESDLPAFDSLSSSDDEVLSRPSRLSTTVGDANTQDVYGFKTPKKTHMKKTSQTPQHKTPIAKKNSQSSQPKTPILKKTPKKPVRSSTRVEATTPYRLRKRHAPGGGEGDSLSSDSDVTDSDSDHGASMQTSTATVQDYFDIHADKVRTSDRTLAKLRRSKRPPKSVEPGVEPETRSKYVKERQVIRKEMKSLYLRWMFELHNGFNLLFYGLGSKRALIEDFRTTKIIGFNHLVINGYFPSLTIKHILLAITDDILDGACAGRSMQDQLEHIRERFSEPGEHFFLIIHNIDGNMLKMDKLQSMFCFMSQIPGFHLIASIDHVNASLLWDQVKSSAFNWIWYDVTTFEPYTDETSYENSLLAHQSGSLALSSLDHVMKSLTPNANDIFRMVVNHQLNHSDSPNYSGIPFQELYQKCREAFLVNSDVTLKAQLTEFIDHKLIQLRKGLGGIELVFIPLETGTLTDFLAHLEI